MEEHYQLGTEISGGLESVGHTWMLWSGVCLAVTAVQSAFPLQGTLFSFWELSMDSAGLGGVL